MFITVVKAGAIDIWASLVATLSVFPRGVGFSTQAAHKVVTVQESVIAQ